MLDRMNAAKRADIQWSKVRLMGANTQPGFEQAMMFQAMKDQLPALRKQWKKLADPLYQQQVMNKFGDKK